MISVPKYEGVILCETYIICIQRIYLLSIFYIYYFYFDELRMF
jgi:hypothetical protein